MCVKCARGTLRLLDAGYSRDFTEMFLWHYTAYPTGNNALEQVTKFLRVKRRNRDRWMRRFDAEMDRIMEPCGQCLSDRCVRGEHDGKRGLGRCLADGCGCQAFAPLTDEQAIQRYGGPAMSALAPAERSEDAS